MAQVWLAQDESLERKVALKRLRPQFAQDASLLARFRREAKTVARLNSPYIVQIYDVGMNERDSFIVMEFVDGQDLKKLLNLQAPLSVDETLELMRELTEGVATAHEAGLIHRDLKPANILISKQGQIKISDFGIARDLTKAGMTQPGTVWGTSDYMAPEQAMGESPAPTMDVYSLGVMMFEMLSGERPYTGRDPVAVMMAHINKPVPSLRRLVPAAPENLSRLVVRLMSKNPASRPQDAGALLKILNSYGKSAKTTILHPVAKPEDTPASSFSPSSTSRQAPANQPDLSTRKLDSSTSFEQAKNDHPDLSTRQLDSSTDFEQRPNKPLSGVVPPSHPDKTSPIDPLIPSSATDSSLKGTQGPTRHWDKQTPPADGYASKPEEAQPTRHWGTGSADSSLEASEGPTRHWATTPQPPTTQSSHSSSSTKGRTPPPFTRDQADAATRHVDSPPAKNNNLMLMAGGGLALVLLLLCLFVGFANGGLNAIIGGDSATITPSQTANAPVTETIAEATFTPTPTEQPPTATPTELPETETALPATSTATTEPPTETPTETPTLIIEPSATPTLIIEPSETVSPSPTIEPILSKPTLTPTVDPYPAPEATPTRLSGAREGNAPDANAIRATGGVNLDGYLTEWNGAQPVYVERAVTGINNWLGPRDLSGIAYFAWDDNYFYMAIERTDDEHLQTRTSYELYRDDSVELWLDFDVYGDLEQDQANGDDYQFAFSAGDFETLPPEGVTYYPDRADYQLAVQAVPLQNGYLLEARIPWTAVGVTPFEEMELGYAVVLNDNDSPQQDEPKSQLSTSRVEPFANPSAFGNLFLR